MRNASTHAVRIDDLDVAGPELSDEELRAASGGLCMMHAVSTCYNDGNGGGEDADWWWC